MKKRLILWLLLVPVCTVMMAERLPVQTPKMSLVIEAVQDKLPR